MKFFNEITRPYDQQIIIDFFHQDRGIYGKIAQGLKSKWDKNRSTHCSVITSDAFLSGNYRNDVHAQKYLRIYIVAHCEVSSDYLFDENHQKIHFNQLAQALNRFIGDDKNAVVNLVSCLAGKGLTDNFVDSFAAKLHKNLNRTDVPVVARVIGLTASKYGKKTISIKDHDLFFHLRWLRDSLPPHSEWWRSLDQKINKLYVKRQFGTKVIFKTDQNNNPIRLDAYLHHWRRKVFKVISEMTANTTMQNKRDLFQKWLTACNNKTDDEIHKIMQEELGNAKSILRDQRRLVDCLFKGEEYKSVRSLLDERKKILASPHTIQPKFL